MTRSIVPLVATLALFVGCSSSDSEKGTSTSSEALTSHKLLNEGSCQFLACRSRFSPRAQPNAPGAFQCSGGRWRTVSFACTGTSIPCSDDDVWLVSPTRQCGASYRVCYGGNNVVAPVRDSSDASAWEASLGLQSALGISPNSNPTVHIYEEGDAAWQNDKACGSPPPDPGNGSSTSGGGGGGGGGGDDGTSGGPSSSGGIGCNPCPVGGCYVDYSCGYAISCIGSCPTGYQCESGTCTQTSVRVCNCDGSDPPGTCDGCGDAP